MFETPERRAKLCEDRGLRRLSIDLTAKFIVKYPWNYINFTRDWCPLRRISWGHETHQKIALILSGTGTGAKFGIVQYYALHYWSVIVNCGLLSPSDVAKPEE